MATYNGTQLKINDIVSTPCYAYFTLYYPFMPKLQQKKIFPC